MLSVLFDKVSWNHKADGRQYYLIIQICLRSSKSHIPVWKDTLARRIKQQTIDE